MKYLYIPKGKSHSSFRGSTAVCGQIQTLMSAIASKGWKTVFTALKFFPCSTPPGLKGHDVTVMLRWNPSEASERREDFYFGSCQLQQQPVWTKGLLHDGFCLDVSAVFGDVHQPETFPVARLPALWVDAVLQKHFVPPPVHLGRELLAVLLSQLDVRRGVHPSSPRLISDQGRGTSFQELWGVVRFPLTGQDDAERAVHAVSVVGDGPGTRPRPEPLIAAVVLLRDSQGGAVPPTGADVLLIPTQELLITILSVGKCRRGKAFT